MCGSSRVSLRSCGMVPAPPVGVVSNLRRNGCFPLEIPHRALAPIPRVASRVGRAALGLRQTPYLSPASGAAGGLPVDILSPHGTKPRGRYLYFSPDFEPRSARLS